MNTNRLKQMKGSRQIWQSAYISPKDFEPDNPWQRFHASQVSFQEPDSSEIIRALFDQLSGKVGENAELRQQVDELRVRLDKHEELLNQIFNPSDLPPLGEFDEWLNSDEAIKNYRGKHVAFVEGKGIVGVADSLKEIEEIIEKNGNPAGVIIGFVPAPATLASKC
ncbi:MAG TPA: DUF5678 domain-containing protein [Verrucomicrobiae bacterium]|nr:DUF5678 domain-containing protein [Verrucomicrobiae bacterium]